MDHWSDNDLDRRVERAILLTRLALGWERLKPALAPPIGVALLFVALAWIGLFAEIGVYLRVAVLGGLAALFVASLWRLAHWRWPSRTEAMARLEFDAGVGHRPLTAYHDELASTSGRDDMTRAVWAFHRRQVARMLAAIRPRWPRADLFRADPFALRSALGLLLVLGIAVAGTEYRSRIASVFDFSSVAGDPGRQMRIDAWVTPPDYTGRPPLFLSSANRTRTADGIAVPEGSTFQIRVQGADDVNVSVERASAVATATDGELEAAEPGTLALDPIESSGSGGLERGPGGEAPRGDALEGKIVINEDMTIRVARGEPIDDWRFRAEIDRAPTARLTSDPEPNARGGFELHYELDDDHAVRSAEARFALAEDSTGPTGEPPRPLFEPPGFSLTLPGGRGGRGAGRTVRDLSSHPWAGAMVEMTLVATDHLDQQGFSEPARFRLPSRPFRQPLAMALIEQRRNLASDANAHVSVIDAIDSIMLYPEGAFHTAGEFLATQQAYRELVAAETDDELREMVDRLWDLAVLIEDGALSDAERALQAAQEALRQALEDGASDEEIERLTQELRDALNRYLQALAQQSQQNAQQLPMDQNTQFMTSQDLNDLLSQIEELAKSGNMEAAEELLAQLQQMLQNLQAGQPQMMPNGMSQAGQMLDELGKMIQRQQELMDQTHDLQRQQQQQQQGQRGQQGQQQQQGQQRQMTPEELAEALRNLQQQQGDLQQQLQEMMQALEDQGLEPGEQLGEAGEQMGEAGEQLGEGQPGRAVGPQGEAIDALRQGAQQLAQQMMGDGMQPGEQMGSAQPGQDRDPLGRFRRNEGADITSRVQIPDEIDVQRARQILEELRRRLGETLRPQIELDYLERLLPGN